MSSIIKQYHYLYRITNLINNKIYIGIHSTDNLDDEYFGGGLNIHRSIKKYGKDNFKKEILEWFDWRCELVNRETEIVNQDFVKRDDVYNIALGGTGGALFLGRTHSDESKVKNCNSHLGRIHSDESRTKISDSLKLCNHHTTGYKHSNETIKKISLTRSKQKLKSSLSKPLVIMNITFETMSHAARYFERSTTWIRNKLKNDSINCYYIKGDTHASY